MKAFLATIACLCIVMSANAQKYDTISRVRVTATKIPQTPEASGRNISIITAADIANSTATSFEELLRQETGININSRGGFGVQSDIGIRGSTFSQVLIMVDNMRLNDPLTGHFNHILPVALSEIGWIEIIRGPAAVAYGSDAVGGLIHIKTLSYLNEFSKDTLTSNGSLNYGSNNYLGTDLNITYKRKKWHVGFANQINYSTGETFLNPNFGKNSAADSIFGTDFNLQQYSLYGSYNFANNLRVLARVGANVRDFNAKYFYTASTFDESREIVNTLWSQVSIIKSKTSQGEHDALRLAPLQPNWEVNLGMRRTQDEFDFNPLIPANRHSMTKMALNANKRFQIKKKAWFSAGLQLENRQIVSTDRGDHQNLDGGLYLIMNTAIRKKTNITFGNRLAYNTNFNFVYLPQLAISHAFHKNLSLQGSIGKSIRSADFTEKYINFNTALIAANRNVGNPDLLNEKSTAFDFGIRYRLKKWHQFSASIFQRNSTNVIDYVNTLGLEIQNLTNVSDSSNYLYTRNIASVNTNGLELGYNVLIPFKSVVTNLRFGVNYTYFNTYNTENVISKYITNHPKHTLNGTVQFHHNNMDVVFETNYIERTASQLNAISGNVRPSYLIVNGKIAYQISHIVKINFRVLNIADEQYQEILGSPMPGRWFVAGLSWKL